MNERFNGVYSGLQKILENTLGRQVQVFGKLREHDDTRILEQYELKKDDNSRSLQVALRFKDSSCCHFEKIVAATIDWGYLQKRVSPLVWLYDDGETGASYRILFDVKQ
jgi:hypothetical protein